jgi:hypothetical protein
VTRPEPLPDQYFSRDLLVLREIAERFAIDLYSQPRAQDIAESLGMGWELVADIGTVLKDAGFVDGIDTDQTGIIIFTKLTPQGRREVGLWPSPDSMADRLLPALGAAIARTPEGGDKTRLERARNAFLGMTREIVVGVATNVMTGQIPT